MNEDCIHFKNRIVEKCKKKKRMNIHVKVICLMKDIYNEYLWVYILDPEKCGFAIYTVAENKAPKCKGYSYGTIKATCSI